MLVPELTRRGRYKSAYAEGTLREKLFGAGARKADGAASGEPVSAGCAGEGGGVERPIHCRAASASHEAIQTSCAARWIASLRSQ